MSHGRSIYLLFYVLAVCRRGIKMEKALLDECAKDGHVALPFPGRVRDNILIVQRTKSSRNCHVTFYKTPNRQDHSLKVIIIVSLHIFDKRIYNFIPNIMKLVIKISVLPTGTQTVRFTCNFLHISSFRVFRLLSSSLLLYSQCFG